MKDEPNRFKLKKIVCLTSKACSFKYSGGVEQSDKSVQRTVKKILNHVFFRQFLSSGASIHKKNDSDEIFAQLFLAQVNTNSLNAFDSKRFPLHCDIKALA